MNTQAHTAPARSLHPALWVAAVSVTAFSAVGIAKLTGVMDPRPAEPAVVSAAAAPVATPPVPEAPVAAPTAAPAPAAAASDGTARKPAAERRTHSKPAVHHAPAVASDEDAPRTVKVADRRYDPGIDVIPAPVAGSTLPPPPVAERAPAPVCADCGQVESVREVKAPADPSGLGAAAGGVVGGLLGNQVGKGSGRTIATLIGIAGGAYAGHQVEKTQRTVSRWEVGVRMENGEYRTVSLDSAPVWRTGDRVRLQGGRLLAADY